MFFTYYNVGGDKLSLRSRVNLVKIKSAIAFEIVIEMSPNFLGISE
jgi:hypothetical protein